MPAWRDPNPKSEYDVVIVGGGGHGLATAYYLVKTFGIKKVAVLERAGLVPGNIGRNTTIIRSNYMMPGNTAFYEFSMKLWETLEQELNYNAMVSQRGVLYLYHSDAQRDIFVRRANAMCLGGGMPNWRQKSSFSPNCLSLISRTRVSRFMAAFISVVVERCAMMLWPGAMRAGLTAWR